MSGSDPSRWAWAEIDLAALAHNVSVIRAAASPAEVWAVVKADGYGHGSVAIARCALGAGATALCVALASEGAALREAGIEVPILVLSQQPPDEVERMLDAQLTPTVYTASYLEALVAAQRRRRTGEPLDIHVKVDTGMQRVGAAPDDAIALIAHAAGSAEVRVGAVYTHLACADEPSSPANAEQLAAFDAVLTELGRAGLRPPVVHAANSAGALAISAARFDAVRAGIAIYGISPGPGVDAFAADLRPVMSLRARVSLVKHVRSGSLVSYGWKHRFAHDTTVATIPIGYADGVARRLGTLPDRPGADVLIHGRRCPIVGVVTMDQLMVDVGAGGADIGDEVVLLGTQGEHSITATDWADRLGTIGYEIVCGIGARVPRVLRWP